MNFITGLGFFGIGIIVVAGVGLLLKRATKGISERRRKNDS